MPNSRQRQSGSHHSVVVIATNRFDDECINPYTVYGAYCACGWKFLPTPDKQKAHDASDQHFTLYRAETFTIESSKTDQ